jgi:lipoprotein-anchoring transpeptidase ErfK/SrfK
MNPNMIEAREYVTRAREALRRGDKDTARDLGEKAVLLQSDLVDAWLVLVAADANPEDALAYARKALELNPASPRVQKALEWAMGQLRQARAGNLREVAESVRDVKSEAPVIRPVKSESRQVPTKKTNRRTLTYVGISLLLCAVIGVAGWSAINNPAFASFMPSSNNPPTQEALWAQVNIQKPVVTPLDVSAFSQQPTSVAVDTPTPVPTNTSTLVPTETPIPTETLTPTPEMTETPGEMAMDILADTPTSVYIPPTNAPAAVAVNNGSGGGGGTRWIDVNLSTQSVVAYEGNTAVNSFIVSTGTWLTPTVTGKYKIWIKFLSTDMSGPGYYLPDVPYVMYFYKGYGLHGTYWHNNFGTPMSHGCVNLRTGDAAWLYNWASVGTVVNVHY